MSRVGGQSEVGLGGRCLWPGWPVLALTAAIWLTAAAPDTAHGCYAVVVGREASADGSVLLGHNEQSGATRTTSLRVVPRRQYASGAEVQLLRGGTLPQVGQTHRAIWSNVPRQEFSDSYMNEWGVAVVSNGCSTREDGYRALVEDGEIRDGGVGFMLRRLIALRARTARDGVELAGGLLDRFGYTDTGRTLVIADGREAWLLSMARGRHWVAQRVPDDGVAILPNVHVIAEVDLADTANFRGSPDLAQYATQRGWFRPEEGKPFSFRAAYNPDDRRDERQWRGQCLVAERYRRWPAQRPLPFAVEPDHRLSVRDVAAILRHHTGRRQSLCTVQTEEGAVFQLRHELPAEVGSVYWRASAEPCMGVLVPWYAGIQETPATYYEPIGLEEHLSLTALHQERATASTPSTGLAWWAFVQIRDHVHEDYSEGIARVRQVAARFEDSVFARQAAVETEAIALYDEGPKAVRAFLTRYSGDAGVQAAELAGQIAEALRSGMPILVVDGE